MKGAITRKLLLHIYWIQYVYYPQKVDTSSIELLSFFTANYHKKNRLKIHFYSGSRFMRRHHFWAEKGSFDPNKIFLENIINIIFIYLLVSFIVQNLKKILTIDPKLWRCTIFVTKMVHLPKWEFFSENLLIIIVPFIHTYLHAKNRCQILIYQWNIDD